MNWEGHVPQVCVVVTFQQSSTMLDTTPIHLPSSAVRPAPVRHSSRLPSVLSLGLCPGGLHAAYLSWRHRGPICKDGTRVWCHGHVSGILPSSVWAQVTPGTYPFVFGSPFPCIGCPRGRGDGGLGGSTPSAWKRCQRAGGSNSKARADKKGTQSRC